MPDEDRRSVLRVALPIEEPGLRADIIDRLGGRAGLRLVEGFDEADVVLRDVADGPGLGDALLDRLNLPQVRLVPDLGRNVPAGSVVLADASGPLLEAVLRLTAEGYVARPGGFEPDWPEADGESEGGGPDDLDRVAPPSLTPREREVLALLAEGAPNKVIARQLQIAPSTAKFHVASLLDKLGARSRLDAVAIGARLGLVLL